MQEGRLDRTQQLVDVLGNLAERINRVERWQEQWRTRNRMVAKLIAEQVKPKGDEQAGQTLGTSTNVWYEAFIRDLIVTLLIQPETGGQGTVGSSGKRFGKVWAVDADLSGTLAALVADFATLRADALGQNLDAGSYRLVAYGAMAPANPEGSALWFDTNVNKLKVWDGSIWDPLH